MTRVVERGRIRSARVIVREGEPADAFYVLVSGTATVLKRGEHGACGTSCVHSVSARLPPPALADLIRSPHPRAFDPVFTDSPAEATVEV